MEINERNIIQVHTSHSARAALLNNNFNNMDVWNCVGCWRSIMSESAAITLNEPRPHFVSHLNALFFFFRLFAVVYVLFTFAWMNNCAFVLRFAYAQVLERCVCHGTGCDWNKPHIEHNGRRCTSLCNAHTDLMERPLCGNKCEPKVNTSTNARSRARTHNGGQFT